MCERRERILRIQLEDERFSDDDEARLAQLSLDDPDQAFLRYQYLVGLWYAWERGLRAKEGEGDPASLLLLSRAPIQVRVAGRIVNITGRSRAAIIRLARHEAMRDLLGERLDYLAERIATLDERRRAGEIGPLRVWRQKRVLLRLADRVAQEWELHYRGIIANALTPDGRAALPKEAPEWWDRLTDEDELRIRAAIWEVGPLRYGAVPRPRKPSKPDAPKGDPITFGALLRVIEGQRRVPPMALEDSDLFQAIHAAELAQRGTAEADAEEMVVV